MIQLITLNKRIATRSQGVFNKPVVNEEEKQIAMTLRYSHLMPDAGKDLVINLYN